MQCKDCPFGTTARWGEEHIVLCPFATQENKSKTKETECDYNELRIWHTVFGTKPWRTQGRKRARKILKPKIMGQILKQ